MLKFMNCQCFECVAMRDAQAPDEPTLQETVDKLVQDSYDKKPAVPMATGWLCPQCGRGNAPYSKSCPCVPLPTPEITC